MSTVCRERVECYADSCNNTRAKRKQEEVGRKEGKTDDILKIEKKNTSANKLFVSLKSNEEDVKGIRC